MPSIDRFFHPEFRNGLLFSLGQKLNCHIKLKVKTTFWPFWAFETCVIFFPVQSRNSSKNDMFKPNFSSVDPFVKQQPSKNLKKRPNLIVVSWFLNYFKTPTCFTPSTEIWTNLAWKRLPVLQKSRSWKESQHFGIKSNLYFLFETDCCLIA